MKTRAMVVSAICGLALAMSSALLGAATPVTSGDLLAQQDDTEVHKGEIKSLDLKNNRFVLAVEEARAKDMTIVITPQTEYTLDGAEAERDDVLKVGMDVTVTTRAKSPVATSVDGSTE